MINLNRIIAVGLKVFLVFAVVLMLGVFLYGRAKVSRYQVSIAFETEPTAEEREATMTLLRSRLGEFARPKWRALISPQPDGTILLTYSKSRGWAGLAESIIPRGACEFRLLDPDKKRLKDAQKNGPAEGYEIITYLETCDGYDETTGEAIRREYPKLVEKNVLLAPKGFKNVFIWTKGIARYTHLRFELKPDDAVRLAAISKEHRGRPLAIIVDGKVRIIMAIGAPAQGGVIEIRALLDNPAMKKLATILRHGPLPRTLRIKDKRSRLID